MQMDLAYQQPLVDPPFAGGDKINSFAILGKCIGEPFDIKVSKGSVSKLNPSENFPKFLTVGTSEFEELNKLLLIDYFGFETVFTEQVKIWNSLVPTLNPTFINWKAALPSKCYKSTLEKIVSYWRQALLGQDIFYYLNVFLPTEKVFSSLVCPIFYSRTETQTGRMKVIHGKNVLKFSKQEKIDLLGSNLFNYSLDYSSIEPSFLLSYAKENFWGDDLKEKFSMFLTTKNNFSVYSFIEHLLKEDFGVVGIPISLIKPILISLIYGASKETAIQNFKTEKEQLKIHFENSDAFIVESIVKIIERIYFLAEIRTKLLSDWTLNNRKFFYNFYGRKIKTSSTFEEYKLISFFSQSSAVDICMLGFLKVVSKIEKSFKGILKPCFLIHDSIVVQANKDRPEAVLELSKIGCVGIAGVPQEFLNLKVEKL